MGNLAGVLFLGGLATVGGLVMANQHPAVAGAPEASARETTPPVPLNITDDSGSGGTSWTIPSTSPTTEPTYTTPDLADPENRIPNDPGGPDDPFGTYAADDPSNPANIPGGVATPTSTKSAKAAKTKTAKQPKQAKPKATKQPKQPKATSTTATTTTTGTTPATTGAKMPTTMPATPTAPHTFKVKIA